MAANYQRSNKPFNWTGSQHGTKSMAVIVNGGTATLQKLVGDDPDSDSWVNVTDGAFSADGELTFYAPQGVYFRITLTGSAVAHISG